MGYNNNNFGMNLGNLDESGQWEAGANVKRKTGAPMPVLQSRRMGLCDGRPITQWRISDDFTAGPWCDTAYDAIQEWNKR